MNYDLEDAKFRYKIAWDEYKKEGSDKKRLGMIMDKAQNYFTWDEFQEFKKELEGYNEFWNNWFKEMNKKVDEFIKKNS